MCRVKAGLEHKQQPVKPEKRGPLDIPDTVRRCGKGEDENPFNEQTAAALCKVFPFLYSPPPSASFLPRGQRVSEWDVIFKFSSCSSPWYHVAWHTNLREGTWLQWKKWSMDTLFLHPCHQCEHMRAHHRMLTTAATKKSLTKLILLKLFHALRTQVLV